MGRPLNPDPRREWFKRRRRARPAPITMQGLARLTGLDADEILERVKRGHLAAVFTQHEAVGLMLLLKRERSRRIIDWDCDELEHDASESEH